MLGHSKRSADEDAEGDEPDVTGTNKSNNNVESMVQNPEDKENDDEAEEDIDFDIMVDKKCLMLEDLPKMGGNLVKAHGSVMMSRTLQPATSSSSLKVNWLRIGRS